MLSFLTGHCAFSFSDRRKSNAYERDWHQECGLAAPGRQSVLPAAPGLPGSLSSSTLWSRSFALSLAPEGKLDLSPFGTLFTDPYYARVLAFTTGQALALDPADPAGRHASCLRLCPLRLSRQVTLPGADHHPLCPAHHGRGGGICRPFWPPGAPEPGADGLPWPGSPPPAPAANPALVLIAHVFYNTSIIVRLVGGFWTNLDPRIEEAARVLGAGRWRTFVEITLPILLPAIVAASLLVFLFCFTSFGVDPGAGRTAAGHHRSRDLLPGRTLFQPATGRRAVHRPDGLYLCHHGPLYAHPGPNRRTPQSSPGRGHPAPPCNRAGKADRLGQRRWAHGPATAAPPGPGRPLLLPGGHLHAALLPGPLYQSRPSPSFTSPRPRRSAIRCSSLGQPSLCRWSSA